MISTIGITGAGTMGRGIAQVAALSGLQVFLYDVSGEILDFAGKRLGEDIDRLVEKGKLDTETAKQALAGIRPATQISTLGSVDFVIEAAIEESTAKERLFRELDAIVRPEVILASNTSSLSITALASFTKKPGRVVGMHFFNPPPIMKLVEVVRGRQTNDETVSVTCDLARRMAKTPVVCKDTPGFIVNRVARPFYGEALRLLGEGVASVEEIDRIVRISGGFKMGPFELMDLIGIDVNYAVTKSVYEQFSHEPRFAPHPIQRRMVEAGTLGRKTGKGFYSY